jgi:hypothetical protein
VVSLCSLWLERLLRQCLRAVENAVMLKNTKNSTAKGAKGLRKERKILNLSNIFFNGAQRYNFLFHEIFNIFSPLH